MGNKEIVVKTSKTLREVKKIIEEVGSSNAYVNPLRRALVGRLFRWENVPSGAEDAFFENDELPAWSIRRTWEGSGDLNWWAADFLVYEDEGGGCTVSMACRGPILTPGEAKKLLQMVADALN